MVMVMSMVLVADGVNTHTQHNTTQPLLLFSLLRPTGLRVCCCRWGVHSRRRLFAIAGGDKTNGAEGVTMSAMMAMHKLMG